MKIILTLLLFYLCSCENKGQVPIKTVVISKPTPKFKDGHRWHTQGITFTTYPPIYSCAYCYGEFSPVSFIPEYYMNMSVESDIEIGGKRLKFSNGYQVFSDSLIKNKINEDSFFFAKWNEIDTSCISRSIKVRESQSIWEEWKKSHKSGVYYLNETDWMSTDGFRGSNGTDSTSAYAMGGRFSDAVLLADKWYKIILDSDKNTKQGVINRLSTQLDTKQKK